MFDEARSTVLFENSRVRVWETVLGPGQATAVHQRHHDHLAIYPDAAVMRLDSGDLGHVQAGLVGYRSVGVAGQACPPIANAGHSPCRHYVIEILGPSATAEPGPLEHNGRARVVPAGSAGPDRRPSLPFEQLSCRPA